MEIKQIKRLILTQQNITTKKYLEENDTDAAQVVNIYTQKLLNAIDQEEPEAPISPSDCKDPIKLGDYVTTDFETPLLSYITVNGAQRLHNLYRIISIEDSTIGLRVLKSRYEVEGTSVYCKDHFIRKVTLSNEAIETFDTYAN